MANQHNSNITNRPFKLLGTEVSTLNIGRELAKKGIFKAKQELEDPFADPPAEPEREGLGRKRKSEADVEEVTTGVKKLKTELNPWNSIDEMEWDEKSGKLYGRWSFGGQ